MEKNKSFTFEESYKRLEEILELLNSGKVSLEDSLKLYEEADKLIVSCSKRLISAEQKIEQLIKNRNGELVLNQEGTPTLEPFSSQKNVAFSTSFEDQKDPF